MDRKCQTIWQLIFLILAINVKGDCSQSLQGTYYAACKFPSEKMACKDTKTGLEITMLTTSSAKDDKIYQTHPNWTADGQHIVFMSDRSGTSQYFAISVKTGTIVQLTDDQQPGNACLGKTRNQMYYLSDSKIWNVDIDSILQCDTPKQENIFRRKVADLPENTSLSGTISLDSNEKDIYLGVQYTANSWGLLATVHPHPSLFPGWFIRTFLLGKKRELGFVPGAI